MKLGSDFFVIWRIVVIILKAIIEVLGSEEDKAEVKKNNL